MDACTKDAQPRWSRRKEARPQELLCAALEIFGEKGFAAARLEDVAKKAGVSKGTVYLYYANKEELFKAVVKEHIAPIVGEAIALQTDNKTAMALIQEAIHIWWDRYGSTKLSTITKIILSEANCFPELGLFFYQEVVQPWWTHLESILKRGVHNLELRPMDTEYTAKVLFAPLVTLAIWKKSMDPCCQINTDPVRYINAHIQMVMDGLLLPRQTR
jgi:AcrR family transcriptional regulator